MEPVRPLRDVFADLADPAAGPDDAGSSDLDPRAALAEYADLPDDLLVTAIGSYANTAPAEVAEHLAQFVTAPGAGADAGLDLLATAPVGVWQGEVDLPGTDGMVGSDGAGVEDLDGLDAAALDADDPDSDGLDSDDLDDAGLHLHDLGSADTLDLDGRDVARDDVGTETADDVDQQDDDQSDDVPTHDAQADDVQTHDVPADDVHTHDLPADDVQTDDVPTHDVPADTYLTEVEDHGGLDHDQPLVEHHGGEPADLEGLDDLPDFDDFDA